MARYAADGSLDNGFGEDGKTISELGVVSGLTVLTEGEIVAAGTVSGDFFLARYESDGTPDAGFGNGGRVVTGFEGKNVEAVALVVQPDGKFVVAGFHPVPDTEHDLVVLARYGPDGSLNAGLGDGGKVHQFRARSARQ